MRVLYTQEYYSTERIVYQTTQKAARGVRQVAGLILEEAALKHEARAMEYRREFLAAGERHINGSFGLEKYTDYREWLRAVDAFLDEKTSPWGVTATTYFTVRKGDGRVVGTLQLRHSLRGELVHGGGHIGYAIRPTERGKGYAKQQLALALEQADRLGIEKVMVSCDRRNAASAAVIRACGGVLSWEGFSEIFHTGIQIYWIDRRIYQQ